MKNNTSKRTKVRTGGKTAKLTALACMMLIMLGAAGFFIFTGNSIETTDESSSEQTTTQTEAETTTAKTTAASDTYTAKGQYEWHKAGIGEYERAKAAQTTTATSASSAASSEQSTTAAEAESTTTSAAPAVTTTTAAATAASTTTTKAVVTTQPTTTTRPATTTPKATTTKAPAAKTIYNSPKIKYTAEEFDMLCYVVQAEAGYCPEYYKIAIANVVINRVKSPRFAYATNIKAVLTASNQFTAISNYYTKANKPNQSTINCCKRALNGEDNSNGAVYYYSPRYVGGAVAAWFESMQLCVAFDSARFFKPW